MKCTDMTHQEFQDYMFSLRRTDQPVFDYVMETYFSKFINSDNPIVDSYNEDPDETWDAMAGMDRYNEYKG